MTTEQIAEMKQCLDEIRGGYTKMKDLPGACEELKTELSGLRKEVDKVRKSRLASTFAQPRRKGWVVSPDCARHLAAVAIIGAERHRKLSHLSGQNRDWVLGRSAEILGVETKAAKDVATFVSQPPIPQRGPGGPRPGGQQPQQPAPSPAKP